MSITLTVICIVFFNASRYSIQSIILCIFKKSEGNLLSLYAPAGVFVGTDLSLL